MNEELLNLIKNKWSVIVDIRKSKGFVEVKIPCMYEDSEMSWIPFWQAPVPVEEIIRKWIDLGGQVYNQPERLSPEDVRNSVSDSLNSTVT